MDEDGEMKPPLLVGGGEGEEDDPGVYNNSLPPIVSRPDLETTVNAAGDDKTAGEDGDNIQVYKRRWYIMIVFSLYAFTQTVVWNTWGPISTTAIEAFNWSESTVAWMNNWGPVTYILTGFFFPWLLQVKGLRWATLISMFCVMVGTAARVITSQPETATILIHIGQFLNGLGGPIAVGAMPALSATWFSPKERVTATAIGTSIGGFGAAIAFVLGPLLVTTDFPPVNMTNILQHNKSLECDECQSYTVEPVNTTNARIDTEREKIMRYMYYECGWSVLLFFVLLIYFPAKPPHPPSVSATTEREQYWSGLWSLRKKGNFLIVAVTYGVSTGVVNCWASVLNINLQPFGVSEETAGWVGFYATIAVGTGSLVISRFADLFARRMKLFILIMFILGLGCFIVFALMLIDIISFSYGNGFINAAVPMLFEFACEVAYPTSEGTANGLVILFNSFWGLIFLGLFSVKAIAEYKMWPNWAVIGTIGISIPLICVFKSRFKRLEVDEGVHPKDFLKQELEVSCDHAVIPSS